MTFSFTIAVESILQGIFYLTGIIAFITIVISTIKEKKSINPYKVMKGIFKLVFDTEGKIDSGRVNLFFGICSFAYILVALVSDNKVANFFVEQPMITSNTVYFLIFSITVIVCVAFVLIHEKKNNIR